MRVLLVEDEAPLRETLAARLKRDGFAVDAAGDGEEGIYLGREVPFDVAIIDLGLPKMSGMELVKQLREAGQRYPILILTARSSWQDKVQGLKNGADDYLVKPFHVEELLAFSRQWPAEDPLLIHCWAGISRSMAATYIVLCDRLGHGSELAAARAIRARAPHAYPNSLLVRHADALLGRDGRMVEAIRSIGAGRMVAEGELVEFPLVEL